MITALPDRDTRVITKRTSILRQSTLIRVWSYSIQLLNTRVCAVNTTKRPQIPFVIRISPAATTTFVWSYKLYDTTFGSCAPF